MDAHLTDLDAILLRVRERRSRDYLREAVSAYRAGAYKAAVIGTWIAVSYDILSKIREIALSGDAAAVAFIGDFDKAIQNTNRERLQKLENQLLQQASDPFGFIGPQELSQLERLKEDRNLCAHPAFSTEAELFQPRAELVRLHIVHAAEMLLITSPVQGKSIIKAFVADLASTAFPRDREQAIRYVNERYLSRLRSGVLENFATVLLKSVLRDGASETNDKDDLLLFSLEAIQRFDRTIWNSEIRVVAERLLEELDAEKLLNAFILIRTFPDLWSLAKEATRIRLRAVVENYDPKIRRTNAIFAGLVIPELRPDITAAFNRADEEHRASIIQHYPHTALIQPALDLLEKAHSYRSAESLFRRFVAPLAREFNTDSVSQLVDVIMLNGEIWDAGDIPRQLVNFVGQIPSLETTKASCWVKLFQFLDENRRADNYDSLWNILRRHGIEVNISDSS